MPLEIREIGIRMTVGDASGGSAGLPDPEAGDSGADAARSLLNAGSGDTARARARLIDQCVAAVLAELARRAER